MTIDPSPHGAPAAPSAPGESSSDGRTQATAHSPSAAYAPLLDFDRYFATRQFAGNVVFSPDGSQVAYIVNTSGQFNIWRQSVYGGWASQVTTFESATVRTLVWAPDNMLYGIADREGNEQYQLFAIPAAGGTLHFLTDRADAQFDLAEDALSLDGAYLAYAGNDRVPSDFDVLIRHVSTGETRRVLANGNFNVPVNWSPDGRYLTIIDLRSNTDLRLAILDMMTGQTRPLLESDEAGVSVPGPWLPDSTGFYLLTDQGRDFKGVARYSLATDTIEWVLTPEWDVEHFVASRDGRRLLWSVNEGGRSTLYLRDEDSHQTLRVAGLPVGVIETLRLAPEGQAAVLRMNAATAPADIYVIAFGPIGSREAPRLRRLTYGMLGGLTPDELVAPEYVHFPTFDGRTVPAWLYRPRGVSDGSPVPLIISIHGGPEAQERVEYHAFYQYLLAQGIGILAPNIRGSTGYGASYQKLIHRDWGGGELKDIQAAAEFARALPWVRADALGVYGGSFGGFAVLSALSRLPEYWAVGVDIVGPSNLLTFVRTVPPTWRRMLAAWVGDPEADAEMLRERSPITYVDQIRAPLLVLQGANDPRVAQAESDQMVERLRQLNREVAYVVFPDEGHGFTRRANQVRAYRLATEFFLRHLMRVNVED